MMGLKYCNECRHRFDADKCIISAGTYYGSGRHQFATTASVTLKRKIFKYPCVKSIELGSGQVSEYSFHWKDVELITGIKRRKRKRSNA